MRFTIITHVEHRKKDSDLFAYGPYVREMNIWAKFADEIEIVAPQSNGIPDPIDLPYVADKIILTPISSFSLLGIGQKINTVLRLPGIVWTIFNAMRQSDHIHLRCPGNIGLLGCIVQILFPSKTKTAKYAGNWDPMSKQPISYRLQKWILSNTFLTKNMKVLVYGSWPGSSSNIVPFFTATYKESDKMESLPRSTDRSLNFLFVGSLAPGKRPLFAIRLVEKLVALGFTATLDVFGEGKERPKLEHYIRENNLQDFVFLKGNQNESTVREAYKDGHFMILPSKSEGWPKAVAEAMFWGCVPLSTDVSCVAEMLDWGKRGILLTLDVEKDAVSVSEIAKNVEGYQQMANQGMQWSRLYTLDKFESEIRTMMIGNKPKVSGS